MISPFVVLVLAGSLVLNGVLLAAVLFLVAIIYVQDEEEQVLRRLVDAEVRKPARRPRWGPPPGEA